MVKNRTLKKIVEDSFINQPKLLKRMKEESKNLEIAMRVREMFKKDPIYLALLNFLKIHREATYSELQGYFPDININEKLSNLEEFGILVGK